MNISSKFSDISGWVVFGGRRIPLLLETYIHLFLAFLVGDDQFTNKTAQISFALESTSKLREVQHDLQVGSGHIPPVGGFNEEYDKLAIEHSCQVDFFRL
jgi:hypothetical protein